MKLWGGRFEKQTAEFVDDFHSSISFDCRLVRQDIEGSIAHATMLGEQGIIPKADADLIVAELRRIMEDVAAGRVEFEVDAEDIHMNVEKILIERIGDAGKKLHTGRSRNDQVALDAHMYVKDACREAQALLKVLLRVILDTAKAHVHTYMPGYTHMQKAQPITLGHHLMAYAEMFLRDIDRFEDTFRRADVMPLGSGALAGTTYPLDRDRVAQLLGFLAVTRNSIDGVADRDFMLDYIYSAALTMGHLSRFCEEIILWATHEFRFIELDDGYSTGSSIMPQKKNPDMAELIRGKSGRVAGDLVGLLMVMKGLPMAYNKDMQEDKEALFDARDTLVKCLPVFTGMLVTAKFRPDFMEKGASGGFTNATDAADYLVRKGMPFRDCHAVVGKMVLDCIKEGKALLDLTLDEMKGYSPYFEEDVYDAIALSTCVEKRNIKGGPAPEAVLAAIDEVEKLI
ncbi:MAG TPA: argininosuccinate lyase [Candidatus Acidoferrum sp.]|nr:argininosuccinate lyase [Candidatus Acidoferrum sp.]